MLLQRAGEQEVPLPHPSHSQVDPPPSSSSNDIGDINPPTVPGLNGQPPPPYAGAGTDVPLTMTEGPPKAEMSNRLTIIVLLAATVFTLFLSSSRGGLDRVIQERRAEELQNHQTFLNHAEAFRATWVLETEDHIKKQGEMAAEQEALEQKLNELQETIKRAQHDWEAAQQDLEMEMRKRKGEYEKWERKQEEREREWERKQGEYENNRKRKQEREEKERRKKEDEDRRRAGMHWGDLVPAQKCLSYGTRKYTAQLVGIPRGSNQLSVCRSTEVYIHGKSMKPDSCEDRGLDGIWGKWVVNFKEPTCITWWKNLNDKGCTAPGSRIRRFEQRLENIEWGDDWKSMCTTTPADFNGLHFDSPTACTSRGGFLVYGYWDVADSSC